MQINGIQFAFQLMKFQTSLRVIISWLSYIQNISLLKKRNDILFSCHGIKISILDESTLKSLCNVPMNCSIQRKLFYKKENHFWEVKILFIKFLDEVNRELITQMIFCHPQNILSHGYMSHKTNRLRERNRIVVQNKRREKKLYYPIILKVVVPYYFE